ncbi:MAG: glycosyltransferase family 4 protein [Woeseia sp.]
MRALVIAPQPFFSPRGTPFSVYYRTLITAEIGVQVDLLTYGEGENVAIPGVHIVRIPNFPLLRNIKIGPSWKKLFLDGFLFLWAVALILRTRFDIVHAHEEAVFFCRFLKPFWKFKLIYDMHSSLPQQLENFSFTQSKFVQKIFERLEVSSLHAADAIITICPALADYVLGIIDDQNKHFLIENSIFEEVKLCSENGAGRKHAHVEPEAALNACPPGRLLVVYSGTFEPYQGLDCFVRSFPTVLATEPRVFFLLIGGTPDQVKKYANLVAELGVSSDCYFAGRVPPTTARAYNGAAGVLVSPRITGTNTPLKIYEMLASGIPIVATNIYAHTQVLTEDVAFLVDPQPDKMARGILEALRNSGQARIKTRAAAELYRSKYSRPVYESKIRKLLALLA